MFIIAILFSQIPKFVCMIDSLKITSGIANRNTSANTSFVLVMDFKKTSSKIGWKCKSSQQRQRKVRLQKIRAIRLDISGKITNNRVDSVDRIKKIEFR